MRKVKANMVTYACFGLFKLSSSSLYGANRGAYTFLNHHDLLVFSLDHVDSVGRVKGKCMDCCSLYIQ